MANGLMIDVIKSSLRDDEGKVLKVYRCPAGKRTIGIGHNLEARPLDGYIAFYLARNGSITDDMAEYILDRDLIDAIASAKRLISQSAWDSLTPTQRGVLVQMTFNMGEGTMLSFVKMRKALENRDIAGAVSSMKNSLWAKQLPERSAKLIQQMKVG